MVLSIGCIERGGVPLDQQISSSVSPKQSGGAQKKEDDIDFVVPLYYSFRPETSDQHCVALIHQFSLLRVKVR